MVLPPTWTTFILGEFSDSATISPLWMSMGIIGPGIPRLTDKLFIISYLRKYSAKIASARHPKNVAAYWPCPHSGHSVASPSYEPHTGHLFIVNLFSQ